MSKMIAGFAWKGLARRALTGRRSRFRASARLTERPANIRRRCLLPEVCYLERLPESAFLSNLPKGKGRSSIRPRARQRDAIGPSTVIQKQYIEGATEPSREIAQRTS